VTTPTPNSQNEAKETLDYIRRTMETASTYTAVSGWGLVVSGAVGILATWLAWLRDIPADLRVWIPAAIVSVAAASVANAMKAKKIDVPVWSGVLRRVFWVVVPVLVAGALLTFALEANGATQLLPGTWLALYGAGVAAGGTFSVRAIRWMGVIFLALGAVALVRPDAGLVMLGIGFGALHIGAGLDITWRHGG
jgi:hypothetical protein